MMKSTWMRGRLRGHRTYGSQYCAVHSVVSHCRKHEEQLLARSVLHQASNRGAVTRTVIVARLLVSQATFRAGVCGRLSLSRLGEGGCGGGSCCLLGDSSCRGCSASDGRARSGSGLCLGKGKGRRSRPARGFGTLLADTSGCNRCLTKGASGAVAAFARGVV
eukprot:scaffold8459_cov267-Pinguiococcus_pyrenoidosus.AAC.8